MTRLLFVYLPTALVHIAFGMTIPFVSIWLRGDIGEGSFALLGLVVAFPNIVAIPGTIFFSNYTDERNGFRKIILLTCIVGTGQYIALLFIGASIEYLVVMGVGALAFPAFYNVISAYATRVCKFNEKGRVVNLLMMSTSMGWFVGSSIGGFFFDRLGMTFVLILSAILVFISGLIFLKNEEPNKMMKQSEEITLPSYFDILKRPDIQKILLPAIIIDFSAGIIFMLGSVYFSEHIGMSTQLIGLSGALATSLGTLILLKYGGYTDTHGRKGVYVVGLLLFPIVFSLLSVTTNVWLVFIIWGFPSYALLRPTISTMISDITTEQERARGLSLVSASSVLSMAIGSTLVGLLTDFTGQLSYWVIIPGFVTWLAPVLGYFLVKETLPLST